MGSASHDQRRSLAIGETLHFDTDVQIALEVLDMGDDTDHAPGRPELMQRCDGILQGARIE